MATEPTDEAAKRGSRTRRSPVQRRLRSSSRAREPAAAAGPLPREDDVVPTLMTMRYRLRSGPVFGTVLATFADDLRALALGPTRACAATCSRARAGLDLGPVRARALAARRLSRGDRLDRRMGARVPGVARRRAPGPPAPAAALRDRGRPGNPAPTGSRRSAACACRATSRSSSPTRRAAGTARRSSLRRAPAGQEEVFTFVEAALSGDQAAEVDRLGVAPLADGLARLIMLPQTRPLTVGVQAPWGWGKSSFVAFVREALVRHAPSNSDSDLELGELEDARRPCSAAPSTRSERSPDAEIAASATRPGRAAPRAARGSSSAARTRTSSACPSTHGATKAPSRCGPGWRARSPRGSRER